MTAHRAWRSAALGGALGVALAAGCGRDVCACSWTSGAVAYGSVTAAATGAPVGGATVRFAVYSGGRADRLCAGGRYPREVQAEAMTDAAGRFRHELQIDNATPEAGCVIASASPPPGGAGAGLGAGEAAGGPVRFRICGARCGTDSVAISVALPPAGDDALRRAGR